MPKIPVYNQGQGPSVQLATGPLSPRAQSSVFEAPGRALASLAGAAGDVAFQFGMNEQKREDTRIASEEYGAAFDTVTTSIFKDTSTDVDTAATNFEEIKTKILSDIDAKGYGKRRSAIVKQGLEKMFLEKQLQAKQQAYNRGRVQSGVAHDEVVSKGLEGLRTTSASDSLFDFKADALRDLSKNADAQGLPSRYNLVNVEKEIQTIRTNNIRDGVQNQIANASKADLVSIEKNIPDLPLQAPEKSVLRQLIKSRETELDNQQVARFASHVPIDNIGNTSFDTVELIEDKIAAARSGDFGADTSLAAEWETLSKEQKVRVERAWQERLQIARSTADYKRKVADKQEVDNNEAMYQDAVQKIYRNSELAISQIQEMEFKGTNGEAMRSQLIDLAGRRARGEILTDSKPSIYRETQQKIWGGEITRLDQKFVLSTDTVEVRRAGGKSLLQRQGNELADKDVASFNTYIEKKRNEADTDENAAYIRNNTRFRKFVEGYKEKIIGNPAFAKLNLNSDSRYYDFTIQMEERFLNAIAEGKEARNLLNPRHPDFIINPDEKWTPTTQELMKEIADSLRTTNQIPNSAQFGPPPRQQGQSSDEYRNSDAYIQWKTGPNYPKWLASVSGENSQ